MGEVSRFAGHTLGEPLAVDRRVKILKARATLSRLRKGEEDEVLLNGAAFGRTESKVEEGIAYRTGVPTMK
jgi:hypothetical protein